MGGELSVLGLISVSLEFYLTFAYEDDGVKKYAYGRATLTVKVEVLFLSTSVEISIEKRFGGSSGDPYFLDTLTSPPSGLSTRAPLRSKSKVEPYG